MKKIPYKIILSEEEMPKQGFNLRAQIKEQPEPFVNPKTGEYCTKEDLLPVFCEELIDQELHDVYLCAESSHAIKAAIDEALACQKSGEKKTIIFGLTGTSYFDMSSYMNYNAGNITDYSPTEKDLQVDFDSLPKIPG